MLNTYINIPDFNLGKALKNFSTALSKGRFSIRRDLSLVFLCGANKSTPSIGPSARRVFLKNAIEKVLPHTRVIYAESVMEELARHDSKVKNLLDIEGQISAIADLIIIVLESNSSFCELGAFAHMSLRNKLMVINDSQFKSAQSFINLGPLQALDELGDGKRVIWYPMRPDGIHKVDAIAPALNDIVRNIRKPRKQKNVVGDECLPSCGSQSSLFFLHDLIYLCGPINHQETIDIYKHIFGDKSYDDIKNLRGILHASNLIDLKNTDSSHTYISKNYETFLDFDKTGKELLNSFRRFHLKHNQVRFT